MEFVREYIYSVCITMIVVSILSVIIPEGKLKGFTSAVLSVFVLFSFISPIKSIGKEISIPYVEEININNEADTYSKLIDTNISNKLKEKGIENTKVACDVRINNNEISIMSAKVYIDDSYNKEEVKKLIYDELGLNAEVYYIGE